MPSILFVCTANLFRSPIAAAALRQALSADPTRDEWVVESAGTWTRNGLPFPQSALPVLSRLGLHGLDRHLSRQVDSAIIDQFDLIIVMESGHKEALATEFPLARKRIYLLSELVDGSQYDIPDPAKPGVHLQAVAAELVQLITQSAARITNQARALHFERNHPGFTPG
jgi:protein-tyrosine phosphatase